LKIDHDGFCLKRDSKKQQPETTCFNSFCYSNKAIVDFFDSWIHLNESGKEWFETSNLHNSVICRWKRTIYTPEVRDLNFVEFCKMIYA
jgi:hypothetical protein